MKIDYSQRKHELPFDNEVPENARTISQPKNRVLYANPEKAQFRMFTGAFF